MPQTCSAIVAKDYYVDQDNQDKQMYRSLVLSVHSKHSESTRFPKIGSTIYTNATLASKFITETYTLCTMNCTTTCDDQTLLEGEINLFIQQMEPTQSQK
jgi:hypothetical protein